MKTEPILNRMFRLAARRRENRCATGQPPRFCVRFRLAPIVGTIAWLAAIVPLSALAASGVTIDMHGAICPNGNSPSWTNWWNHAVTAVQSGIASTGNAASDPSAWVERTTFRYIEVIETLDPDPRVSLGFNSWLGFADPIGAASQESGGMVAGLGRILGNGTKVKLSNLHWSWNDDGGAFSLTNSRAMTSYGFGMVGINYGPDGKLGGADDILYTSGASATNLVDEIIIIASGGFYYAKTYDFQSPPDGLSHQEILNWADNEITTNDNYASSNTVGFYLYDDNNALVASSALKFNIIDQPTLYTGRVGNQLVVAWPGSPFALETSPTVGATASWTPVTGATNSPAMVPLSGGKPAFYRLRKQ